MGNQPSAAYYAATTGYFSALRIPIRSGRDFNEHDDAAAPHVAIISESMVIAGFRTASMREYCESARIAVQDSTTVTTAACTTCGHQPKPLWRNIAPKMSWT